MSGAEPSVVVYALTAVVLAGIAIDRVRTIGGPDIGFDFRVIDPSLVANQNVRLSIAVHPIAAGRHAWVQVVRGAVTVNGAVAREISTAWR